MQLRSKYCPRLNSLRYIYRQRERTSFSQRYNTSRIDGKKHSSALRDQTNTESFRQLEGGYSSFKHEYTTNASYNQNTSPLLNRTQYGGSRQLNRGNSSIMRAYIELSQNPHRPQYRSSPNTNHQLGNTTSAECSENLKVLQDRTKF